MNLFFQLRYIIPFIFFSFLSCNNDSSRKEKELEKENAKLKEKIYQDSIKNLKKQLDLQKTKKEEHQKLVDTKNAELEKKQKNEAKNKRFEWLKKYATNDEALARYILNTAEFRWMKILNDKSFNIKTYEGFGDNQKQTGEIKGDLSDLNPKSVRIYYNERYFYIHINCISGNCIKSLFIDDPDYNTVSFGPYNQNHINGFPEKLKKAFEDVIFDLNQHTEYY